MPLRDHFHSPLVNQRPWDGLHGAWPALIVVELNGRFSAQYVSQPHVHLGPACDIDLVTYEQTESALRPKIPDATGNESDRDAPAQDEYEVRVFETIDWRLVAAIEIVSPAKKDRTAHRRAFVAKCVTLLRQGVSVSIIDVVTNHRANLYHELIELLGHSDPSAEAATPPLYAAACRWLQKNKSWRLETWVNVLEIAKPLPTLPLWLSPDLAMPLDLESSYEETCRALRITR